MITKHTYAGETWVDLFHATAEEITEVTGTYHIHPLVARELSSTTRKPRAEFHDDYIYCILHFPAFKHTHGEETKQEVDFIIGKKVLITTRYDTIDALYTYSKSLEVKEILSKDSELPHSHTLFIEMLRELYASLFDELSYIEDMTDDITKRIFLGQEKEMVISISNVTRTILDFKKATDLHKDVLEELIEKGSEIFGKKFAKEMEVILLDYSKIQNTVTSIMELLRELRKTNNSLLSTKQNETIRTLTVMGFIMFPLNLISVVFAMRVGGLPLVDNPNGFLMILVVMCTLVLITLIYSKSKKWL